MPFRFTQKTKCVFYALLVSSTLGTLAHGQGYADSRGYADGQPYADNRGLNRIESRSSRHSGMVDQLSRGESTVSIRRPVLSGDIGTVERDTRSVIPESPLRPSAGGEPVVALRPQPMSVRQANFESSDQLGGLYSDEQAQLQSRQQLDRLNAQEHYQSFIEREQAAAPSEKADATEMLSRIGINLVFVLALAVGGILFVRQLQKGKQGSKATTPTDLAGLKIDQVLQVTRGVSLYLVDSMASKILVAVDGGGIKSVSVLPSRFEDELDDPEAFSRPKEPDALAARAGGTNATRQASRRSVNKTSSSEIDENLIRLLLSKSKEAA
ncbi:hypothetical protein Mal15_25740 [Stieleria maiorica]|uniref:Flagellar biosynthesis protein, FliO n=1 Tax=Stieleria maiorica TaxID=2795974 RepID=A0A5B9MBG0_9BACT|nr:hypothetical protein [Stieleria maiorica]QEF98522.1 hypothetical protein Mal15_25740 [Stieleria maiorica]